MDTDITDSRRASIPPELWRMIINCLPRDTARECLLVSRMFYGFTAPLLFSTIRLRFGSWQVGYGYTWNPPEEDSGSRSCCILLRIIADPVFASYVKYLQVIAFPGHDAKFELCCITRAIGCLQNLRALEWRSPQQEMVPPIELFETLASSCPHFERLEVPLHCLSACQPLTRLSIKSLSVHITHLYVPGPTEEDYERNRIPLRSVLESCRGSLTRLWIFGLALWEAPIYILQDLEELSIYSATNMSNTVLLVHHCVRLRSLSVHSDNDVAAASQFYDVLAAHPESFPNLTHFKLHSSAGERGQSGTLARFLREKKQLRCFDCGNWHNSIEEIEPILSVLPSLTRLEVVGLSLWCSEVNTEFYQNLRRAFPNGLTALRLDVDYDDCDEDAADRYSLWTSLPKLAFAYVSDTAGLPLIETRELATQAKGLQLVGHRALFREITRMGEEVVLGSYWSETKVQFPTVNEYGDEDWLWLMKGHELIVQFNYE